MRTHFSARRKPGPNVERRGWPRFHPDRGPPGTSRVVVDDGATPDGGACLMPVVLLRGWSGSTMDPIPPVGELGGGGVGETMTVSNWKGSAVGSFPAPASGGEGMKAEVMGSCSAGPAGWCEG